MRLNKILYDTNKPKKLTKLVTRSMTLIICSNNNCDQIIKNNYHYCFQIICHTNLLKGT